MSGQNSGRSRSQQSRRTLPLAPSVGEVATGGTAMAVLRIKNLPDALYRKLQARAKREHRSVAQEVTHLLSLALDRPKPLSILDLLKGSGREHWRGASTPRRTCAPSVTRGTDGARPAEPPDVAVSASCSEQAPSTLRVRSGDGRPRPGTSPSSPTPPGTPSGPLSRRARPMSRSDRDPVHHRRRAGPDRPARARS